AERVAVRHTRKRADGLAVDHDFGADWRGCCERESAQQLRDMAAARVDAGDQFLTRVTTLGEADRLVNDRLAELGWDRPLVDLGAHLGPAGRYAVCFTAPVVAALDGVDVGLRSQLEPAQTGDQRLAPTLVCLEH